MDWGKFIACVGFSVVLWIVQTSIDEDGKLKWKSQAKFVILVAGIAFAYAVGYDQGVKGE